MQISQKTGSSVYRPVIIGALLASMHVKVDVSTLTTDEVDAKGNIKPGVPLGRDGKKLSGAAGEAVLGVVPEAIKIVPPNPTNSTLAATTDDVFVGVAVIAAVDRDDIEKNLGRALSANEIAGFESGKCKLVLSRV
jgi:hypothetical protein